MSRLAIDGEQNGGVTVIGWDQNTVRIRARVQAHGRSPSAARIAEAIRIQAGGTIRAEGPVERRVNWSVSYVINAPRRTDLTCARSTAGSRSSRSRARFASRR